LKLPALLAGALTRSGNMGIVSVVPRAGLAAGDHTGALAFTFNNGRAVSVPLSVTVGVTEGFAATVTPDGSDYIVGIKSGADVTVTVIAAVYDAADRLADIKTASEAISAGAPPAVKTFEGITVPGGGTVKFFFWDSETHVPLCAPQ
jgi:hypothetical protein